MIKYCTTCLLPSTKPDLRFDENGVCSACLAYRNRTEIDWEVRKKEFDLIISKFGVKIVKMSMADRHQHKNPHC